MTVMNTPSKEKVSMKPWAEWGMRITVGTVVLLTPLLWFVLQGLWKVNHDLLQQLHAQDQTQQQHIKLLEQLQTQLQEQQKMLRAPHRWVRDRLLQDIKLLLQRVEWQWQTEHDPENVAAALNLAVQWVEALHDPSLQKLQQALRTDSQHIKILATKDKIFILAKVDALEKVIADLPMAPTLNSATSDISSSTAAKTESWRAHWQKALATLEKLVVIRHTEQPIQPLLTNEQRFYLQYMFTVAFAELRWSILHQDALAYKKSIARMQIWLETYFKSHSERTQPVMDELQRLAAIDIASQPFSLKASLDALTELQAA